LAARLAAAMAAGAYTAHLHPAAVAEGGANPETGGSMSQDAADGAGCGLSACGASATCSCTGGSSMCCLSSQLLIGLRCWEPGDAMQLPSGAAACAALQEAARQRGITLQQYLKQQLLALAWRHPLPYVCGNVLCGRLEGVSAVGAVRVPETPRGTLCGRCRAAWYCCEGCQKAACRPSCPAGQHTGRCARGPHELSCLTAASAWLVAVCGCWL
jgi:hypothetical protein